MNLFRKLLTLLQMLTQGMLIVSESILIYLFIYLILFNNIDTSKKFQYKLKILCFKLTCKK